MRASRFLAGAAGLCIGMLGFALVPATAVLAGAGGGGGQSLCIAHHPQGYVWYTRSCTGHDEPEIDPLSNHAGSARDLTWTIVLPTNDTVQVDSVGPTFWIGGTVTDPNSLFGEAFLELQFYPNSIVQTCGAGGGYNVRYAPNTYSVCSPVWRVSQHGNSESAAFNAMLTDGASGGPLIMHAGDTVTDHQYVTPAADGMHITVTDLTTGHSGTIVLDAKGGDGPLMPAFDVQRLGDALSWGLVNDSPNSLVWEIGHTANFTTPAGKFCLPGSATKPPCYSYNVPTWLKFSPLRILGVTFGDGSSARSWSVVSDFGGKAEVDQYCGAANYGAPFCTYPWFAKNGSAFTYGGDYPGTTNDFGRAGQFEQAKRCTSPIGGSPQYCSTVIQR
jgi:hypothetical protein